MPRKLLDIVQAGSYVPKNVCLSDKEEFNYVYDPDTGNWKRGKTWMVRG